MLIEGALLSGEPQLTWNLVADVREMLQYPFMVNALRAGTVVAVLAGFVGWFMVLRRQTFAGHTLAVVGFPGAAGAVLLGVSATYGYFVFAVAAALVIAAVPGAGARGRGDESAVTGTVGALALGFGYLFVSLYGGFLSGVNALLFGSFLGISSRQVVTLLAVAVVTLAVLAFAGRPLLFASVDPAVAEARGVPVRALSTAFLVLLGVAAAAVSQITGSLLVFALLVVPAAAAQRLSARPFASLVTAVALGLGITWSALFVAYFFASYPIGFLLTSIAFAVFLVAAGWRRLRTGVPA